MLSTPKRIKLAGETLNNGSMQYSVTDYLGRRCCSMHGLNVFDIKFKMESCDCMNDSHPMFIYVFEILHVQSFYENNTYVSIGLHFFMSHNTYMKDGFKLHTFHTCKN